MPCAHGACPKEFSKQWTALANSHSGPLGLLLLHREFSRVHAVYGDPASWISQGVSLANQVPLQPVGAAVTHDRLWLVVQGHGIDRAEAAAAREAAEKLNPAWVLVSGVRIDQSWEPRVIPAQ